MFHTTALFSRSGHLYSIASLSLIYGYYEAMVIQLLSIHGFRVLPEVWLCVLSRQVSLGLRLDCFDVFKNRLGYAHLETREFATYSTTQMMT
jgi:hypothetical protein